LFDIGTYFWEPMRSSTIVAGTGTLFGRTLRETLLAAQPHVDFALTDAALPRKQTEQGKQRTLDDTFPRKTAELVMATGRTGTHKDLKQLSMELGIRWQDTLSRGLTSHLKIAGQPSKNRECSLSDMIRSR
jgi:hypothetical protein